MSNKYKVLVVGMGKRGQHHALAFHGNPRFEVAGICDIDRGRCEAAAPKLGNPQVGVDAAALAKAIRPDLFCFCTLPNLRSEMIALGVESGAKLIAFEKPVAMTSAEGLKVKRLLEGKGVKAVVSHQHRYGVHYQKVKEIVASGALGKVHTVYGTATGWMAHMLSHLIDYTCWFNNYVGADWAMAQAAGRAKLADIHTSPDYISGRGALPERRARDLRLRRGRARRARGAVLVAEMPDRRARERRICRSDDRRGMACGDAGRGGDGRRRDEL